MDGSPSSWLFTPPSRRRGTRDHKPTVFWVWAALFIPAAVFILVTSNEESRDEAVLFLILVTIMAYLMFSFNNILVIGIIFGPRLAIAVVSALTSSSKLHWNKETLIAIFPIWIVFGVLAVFTLVKVSTALAALVVYTTNRYGPVIVYYLSFRTLVARSPRYRSSRPFPDLRLCKNCQGALGRSSLLFGTRFLLARVEERHPFFDSLEDMKRSWRSCPLCEALLVSKTGAAPQRVDTIQSYGTIANNSANSEDGLLFIDIRLHKDSTFLDEFGLGFAISLRTRDATISKELIILEGPLEAQVEVNEYTGSQTVMAKVRSWVDQCAAFDETCAGTTESSMPTRILFLGTLTAPDLRLVLASELTEATAPKYAAMSHCWGGDLDCKLKTENLQSMKVEIDYPALSKNFQDAINIARNLDVQYLWIDSLCIIQNSESDWAEVSPTMGQVYKNAHFVISATASENSEGGCFRYRKPRPAAMTLISSADTHYFLSTQGPSELLPSIKTLFDTRVETAPLAKRAWAFQERLLSRRLVHFCSDIVLFECNTNRASELHPHVERYEKETYVILNGRVFDWIHDLARLLRFAGFREDNVLDRSASRGIRGALDVLRALGPANEFGLREKLEFNRRWYELVSAYSEGALTRPTDKLIAISGIAELVQDRSGSAYHAGIWGSVAPEFALLWKVKGPPGMRLQPYCAPSWSWASADNRIDLLPDLDFTRPGFKENHVHFLSKVENAVVTYQEKPVSTARSLVDDGFLEIRGPVFVVYPRPSQPLILDLRRTTMNLFSDSKLHFYPDWLSDMDEGDSSERLRNWSSPYGESLLAVQIMTVEDGWLTSASATTYGLVIREKKEPGFRSTYERVGVFATPKLNSRQAKSFKSLDYEIRNVRIA